MNKKLRKIIIGITLVIMILIIGIIVCDRITINNQYHISEKNLQIPIFVYHNIVENESEIKYDYMQTSRETFEKQIIELQNYGYHFISYDDLIEYKNGNKKIYKKSCLITFDDGCEGVYRNAYPIIHKYNIPITIFIITDNINASGVVTWEEAKEMQDSGLVTIASHSTNHLEYTNLSKDQAVTNVEESYKAIEKNLGIQDRKIFTYPYGLYTEEQVNTLKDRGYIQNLTDNKINKSKDLNLYSLHRCYPLNDSIYKILAKIAYRSIRYD